MPTRPMPPARLSTARIELLYLVVAVLVALPALWRIMGTSSGTWLLIDWIFLVAGVALGVKCVVALLRIRKARQQG